MGPAKTSAVLCYGLKFEVTFPLVPASCGIHVIGDSKALRSKGSQNSTDSESYDELSPSGSRNASSGAAKL